MPDMQCSWFFELWIGVCCKLHDLGASDLEFFKCIIAVSEFLGPLAYPFAFVIVLGMVLGRPIRNFYLKHFKKDDK